MNSRTQAPLKFVKSHVMRDHYPAEAIAQAEELLDTMRFIEQMLPDRTIIMCQRASNPRVQYVTPNCKSVFDCDTDEIYRMSLPEFLELTHPDDIAEVHQCFAIINSLEPYDPTEYRFTLHYRIRHKDGSFVSITDEKFALKSRQGRYIYLNSFKDITATDKFYDVKMYVHRLVRGELKLAQTYIPRLRQAEITPRQKDIANLIAKGFTNTEIANVLSVSVNTVKNHKTQLFRKVNVKSAIELNTRELSGMEFLG